MFPVRGDLRPGPQTSRVTEALGKRGTIVQLRGGRQRPFNSFPGQRFSLGAPATQHWMVSLCLDLLRR